MTDEDPSHYFGHFAAIDIEKATNGEDADAPTGPFVAVDGAVGLPSTGAVLPLAALAAGGLLTSFGLLLIAGIRRRKDA